MASKFDILKEILKISAIELKPIQEKMQEYLNSDLRLGWLINPQDEEVEIYRANSEVEVLQFPVSLSGEDVLPGFVLNLPSV